MTKSPRAAANFIRLAPGLAMALVLLGTMWIPGVAEAACGSAPKKPAPNCNFWKCNAENVWVAWPMSTGTTCAVSTPAGPAYGVCDGGVVLPNIIEPEMIGQCCVDTTGVRLPPILVGLGYAPQGQYSTLAVESSSTQAAGFRFQLSDGGGQALRLEVGPRTVQGDFSVSRVTSHSVAVAQRNGTAYSVPGSVPAIHDWDPQIWKQDHFRVWVNAKITMCPNEATYLVSTDDAAYSQHGAYCTLAGPRVLEYTGSELAATTSPFSDACHTAIWSDVKAVASELLGEDPFYVLGPMPSAIDLQAFDDTGSPDYRPRFVATTIVDIGAQQDGMARLPRFVSTTNCQAAGQGSVLELSTTKYRSRQFAAFGKTLSLDLQFMATTASCNSIELSADIMTSATCGPQSTNYQLRGSGYLDVVHGTLLFLPTQQPQPAPNGGVCY